MVIQGIILFSHLLHPRGADAERVRAVPEAQEVLVAEAQMEPQAALALLGKVLLGPLALLEPGAVVVGRVQPQPIRMAQTVLQVQ